MTSFNGRRAQLGGPLAVAVAALSIFVLPGLANARGGGDDGGSRASVKSFDPARRVLVVALPDGQSVSGTVTRRTKIRCEDQRGRRGRGHGHGANRPRGREAEPGDDHGGRGVEPGDDHGGDSAGSAPASSGRGHDDSGRGANCTTANLVPGAAVEEIELEFRGSAVVFDEVELDD